MSIPLQPLTGLRYDRHPEALARFTEETSGHRMSVLLDAGVYRHLHFAAPGSGFNHFEITTAPGRLTIAGDMGTYVFEREHDMALDFFNGNSVNARYWGEKLQAVDRRTGYLEHSEDSFKAWILQDFWGASRVMDAATARETWREIREQILGEDSDRTSTNACHNLLAGFRHEGYGYDDYWNEDWNEYTSHYLWVCHAILAGLTTYRAAQEATKPAGAPRHPVPQGPGVVAVSLAPGERFIDSTGLAGTVTDAGDGAHLDIGGGYVRHTALADIAAAVHRVA